MAMTGTTPANRAYENCTIGAVSYALAKSESKSNRLFVFFFSMMLQAALKTNLFF